MATPWRRYLAEMAVIIASILLALFFDAAWDDYQDRQREQGYLSDLEEEFLYASAELGRDQERRKEMLARMKAFVDGDADADVGLLLDMVDYRAFNPSHAVLEDLVGSGNFGLLKSDSLREALLRYQQDVDRLRVGELRDREFVSEQVEPFLLHHLELRRL